MSEKTPVKETKPKDGQEGNKGAAPSPDLFPRPPSVAKEDGDVVASQPVVAGEDDTASKNGTTLPGQPIQSSNARGDTDDDATPLEVNPSRPPIPVLKTTDEKKDQKGQTYHSGGGLSKFFPGKPKGDKKKEPFDALGFISFMVAESASFEVAQSPPTKPEKNDPRSVAISVRVHMAASSPALSVCTAALCKYHSHSYLRRRFGSQKSSVIANVAYYNQDVWQVLMTLFIDEVEPDKAVGGTNPTPRTQTHFEHYRKHHGATATAKVVNPLSGKEVECGVRGILICNDRASRDNAMDDVMMSEAWEGLSIGRALAMKLLRYYTSEPESRDLHHGWSKLHWIRMVQSLFLSPVQTEESDKYQSYLDHAMKENPTSSHILNEVTMRAVLGSYPGAGGGELPTPFKVTEEDFKVQDNDGWYPVHWMLYTLLNSYNILQKKLGACSDTDDVAKIRGLEKKQAEVGDVLLKFVQDTPSTLRKRLLMLPVDMVERDVRSLLGHWVANVKDKTYNSSMSASFMSTLGVPSSPGMTDEKHNADMNASSGSPDGFKEREKELEIKLSKAYSQSLWSKEKGSKFEYKGYMRQNFLDQRVYFTSNASFRHVICAHDSDIANHATGETLFWKWYESGKFTICDVLDRDWVELKRVAKPVESTTTTTTTMSTPPPTSKSHSFDAKDEGDDGDYFFFPTHVLTLKDPHQTPGEMSIPLLKDLHFSDRQRCEVKLTIRRTYDPIEELEFGDPDTADDFAGIGQQSTTMSMSFVGGADEADLKPALVNCKMLITRNGKSYNVWHNDLITKRRYDTQYSGPQDRCDRDTKSCFENSIVALNFTHLHLFELGFIDEHDDSEDRGSELMFHRKFPRRRATFLHWLSERRGCIGILQEFLKSVSDIKEKNRMMRTFDRQFMFPLTCIVDQCQPDPDDDDTKTGFPADLAGLMDAMGKENVYWNLVEQMRVPWRGNHPFYETFINAGFCMGYFDQLVSEITKGFKPPAFHEKYSLTALIYYTFIMSAAGSADKESLRMAMVKLKSLPDVTSTSAGTTKQLTIVNEDLIPCRTPLVNAVTSGDIDCLSMLHAEEVEVDASAIHAIALWAAFRHDEFECARWLLDKNFNVNFAMYACFSSGHPEVRYKNATVPFFPPSRKEVEFFEENGLFKKGYHHHVLINVKTWYKAHDVECSYALGALMDSRSTDYVELINNKFLRVVNRFPLIKRAGELFVTLMWGCSSTVFVEKRWGFTGGRGSPATRRMDVFVGEVQIPKDAVISSLGAPFHFLLDKAFTFSPVRMEFWTNPWSDPDEIKRRRKSEGDSASLSGIMPKPKEETIALKSRTEHMQDVLNFGICGLKLSRVKVTIDDDSFASVFYHTKDGKLSIKMGRKQMKFTLEDTKGRYPKARGVMSALGKVTIDPSSYSAFIPPAAVYFAFMYPSKAEAPITKKCSYYYLIHVGGYVYFNAAGEVVNLVALTSSDDLLISTNDEDPTAALKAPSPSPSPPPPPAPGTGSSPTPDGSGGPLAVLGDEEEDDDEDFPFVDHETLFKPLTFIGPFMLTHRDTNKLGPRWKTTTCRTLNKLGAKQFAWLCPGESDELHSKVEIPDGAFAYNFPNEDQTVVFTLHLMGQQAPPLSAQQDAHIQLACQTATYLNTTVRTILRNKSELAGHMDEFRKFLKKVPLGVPEPKDQRHFPKLHSWGIANMTPLRLAVHLHRVELLRAMIQTGDDGLSIDWRRVIAKKVEGPKEASDLSQTVSGGGAAAGGLEDTQREQIEKYQYEDYQDLWYRPKDEALNALVPNMTVEDKEKYHPLHGSVLGQAIRLSFQPPLNFMYRPPARSDQRLRLFLREIDPKPGNFKVENGALIFTYLGKEVPVGTFEFAKGAVRSSLGLNLPNEALFYVLILANDAHPLLKHGGFVFLSQPLLDKSESPPFTVVSVRSFTYSLKDAVGLGKVYDAGKIFTPPYETYSTVLHLSGPFCIPRSIAANAIYGQLSVTREYQKKVEEKKASMASPPSPPNSGGTATPALSRRGSKAQLEVVPPEKQVEDELRKQLENEVFTPEDDGRFYWAPCSFHTNFAPVFSDPKAKNVPYINALPAVPYGGLIVTTKDMAFLYVIQEKAVTWNPVIGAPEQPHVPERAEIVEMLVKSSTKRQVVSVDDNRIWDHTDLTPFVDRFGIFFDWINGKKHLTTDGFSSLLQFGYLPLLKRYSILAKAPFRSARDGINAILTKRLANRVAIYFPKDLARTVGFKMEYREDTGLGMLHWAALCNDSEFAHSIVEDYHWDLWEDGGQRSEDRMCTELRYMTPMHYAAYNGNAAMITYFFKDAQKKGSLPFCNMTIQQADLIPDREYLETDEIEGLPSSRPWLDKMQFTLSNVTFGDLLEKINPFHEKEGPEYTKHKSLHIIKPDAAVTQSMALLTDEEKEKEELHDVRASSAISTTSPLEVPLEEKQKKERKSVIFEPGVVEAEEEKQKEKSPQPMKRDSVVDITNSPVISPSKSPGDAANSRKNSVSDSNAPSPSTPATSKPKKDAQYVIYPERALFIASKFGHHEAAFVLVENGADPIFETQVPISNCFNTKVLSEVRMDSHDVVIARAMAHEVLHPDENEEDNEEDDGGDGGGVERLGGLKSLLDRYEKVPSTKGKMLRNAALHIVFETLVPLLIVVLGLLYFRLLFADQTVSEVRAGTYWTARSIGQQLLDNVGWDGVSSKDSLIQFFHDLPAATTVLLGRAFLIGAIQISAMFNAEAGCSFPNTPFFIDQNITCYSDEAVKPPVEFSMNRSFDQFIYASQVFVNYRDFFVWRYPGNFSLQETSDFFSTTVDDIVKRPSLSVLIAHLNFYVPTLDRIVVLRVTSAMFPSGAVVPESKIDVFRQSFYTQGPQDRWRYFVEVCSLVLLVGLVGFLGMNVYREFRLTRTEEMKIGDLADFALHVINLERWRLFLIIILIINFSFYGDFRTAAKDFESVVYKAFSDVTLFVDAEALTFSVDNQRITVALVVAISAFGVTSGIRYIPFGIGQPADAILRTIISGPVLVFFFLFVIIWAAIAVTLFTLYSPDLNQYRSFWPTVLETFTMMSMGESDKYVELNSVNPVMTPVVMLLIVVCIQFAFLNILIAVIGQVYEDRLREAEQRWSADIREIIRRSKGRNHRLITQDVLYLSSKTNAPAAEDEFMFEMKKEAGGRLINEGFSAKDRLKLAAAAMKEVQEEEAAAAAARGK